MCALELEGGARCLLVLAQRECLFRVVELVLYADGRLGLFLTVDKKPIADAASSADPSAVLLHILGRTISNPVTSTRTSIAMSPFLIPPSTLK